VVKKIRAPERTRMFLCGPPGRLHGEQRRLHPVLIVTSAAPTPQRSSRTRTSGRSVVGFFLLTGLGPVRGSRWPFSPADSARHHQPQQKDEIEVEPAGQDGATTPNPSLLSRHLWQLAPQASGVRRLPNCLNSHIKNFAGTRERPCCPLVSFATFATSTR